MKGLAAMKVDEVFTILDNQLKKKGMVRIEFFSLLHWRCFEIFLTVKTIKRHNPTPFLFQLSQRFLTLFRNKDVDTNIRGLIVEMFALKSLNNSKDRISLGTMEGIIKCLTEDTSSSGREFLGFMMSRLNELATEDAYLKSLLG